MDITVSASKVELYPINGKEMSEELINVDVSRIIDAIGRDEILQEIGRDEVIEYFNIIEME